MQHLRCLAPLGLFLASACQSYSPVPVDLAAHARAFAARLPDPETVRTFSPEGAAAGSRDGASADGAVLGHGGITLATARRIALVFHPDCRLARLRAGVALAIADHAGRWQDPVLGVSFERILESVQHPWIVASSLGLTLPLTGRLGLEKELRRGEHAQALLDARLAERHVITRVNLTWLQWSAASRRTELLQDLCARLDELCAIADRLAAAREITQMQARAFRLERTTRGHELAAATAAVARGRLELLALLGLHPEAPIELLPTLELPPATAEAGAAEADVPSLQQLQLAHTTSERALQLAIRRQWPDLVLSPGFGEEDAQPRAALGFSVPLPLFSGNDEAIAKARAERDLAAEALRCGHEQFVQELALAQQQERAASEQRERLTRELLPMAAQQVEDGRRLAELGQLDTLLILDALMRAHAARELVLDTTLAAASAGATREALFWPTLAGAPTTTLSPQVR